LKKQLILEFPVIGRVLVKINDIRFSVFVERQLSSYILDTKPCDGFDGDIEIVFSGQSFIMDRLPHVKFYASGSVALSKSEITIEKKYSFKSFNYTYCNNLKDVVVNISEKPLLYFNFSKLKQGEYSYFQGRFYELILKPIISMISLAGSYKVIHGAIASNGKRRILIYGQDGVGKSSIMGELGKNGYSIESDNLSLFNGVSAIGLSVPIRLEKNKERPGACRLLYQAKNFNEWLPNNNSLLGFDLTNIYCLTRGSASLRKECITTMERMVSISNGAPEVNNLNEFISFVSYVDLLNNDNTNLSSVIDANHEMITNVNGSLSRVIEEIL
jgi:hypothetical protein